MLVCWDGDGSCMLMLGMGMRDVGDRRKWGRDGGEDYSSWRWVGNETAVWRRRKGGELICVLYGFVIELHNARRGILMSWVLLCIRPCAIVCSQPYCVLSVFSFHSRASFFQPV